MSKHELGKSIVQAAEEQALSRDYKTEISILTLLPDLYSIFSSQMFQFAFSIVVSLGTELISRELLESPFQNFFRYSHLFQRDVFKGVSNVFLENFSITQLQSAHHMHSLIDNFCP